MVPKLNTPKLEKYLRTAVGAPVKVLGVRPLAATSDVTTGKGYGYGIPLLVEYKSRGRAAAVVVETVRPGPFGHEYMADRARDLLWAHHAYNQLPRHARSPDVGAFCKNGHLMSLGQAKECFLLVEYVRGSEYAQDLMRLRRGEPLTKLDTARADALCDYLVRIHRVRGDNPQLYVRRIRELLGHGECIMGVIDGYPTRRGFPGAALLSRVEQKCLSWRWKIKRRTDRLRQVHGDFHPWNILFRRGANFAVLDRSRGEWGDPADDVTCLTMNYLFFSLQRHGRLTGSFEILFRRFWDNYLLNSRDQEILRVAAPFIAFRALVMASPVWYPNLSSSVRRKLFALMLNCLDADSFDPKRVNAYCKA